MRLICTACVGLLVSMAVLTGVGAGAQVPARSGAPADDRFWPQWRGPLASGVSATAKPPLEWSETKNIRWKVEIPGRGTGTPVVWENQIFLTTAIPAGAALASSHDPRGGMTPRALHQFKVLSIDRQTGRTLWERLVREEVPHEATPSRLRAPRAT